MKPAAKLKAERAELARRVDSLRSELAAATEARDAARAELSNLHSSAANFDRTLADKLHDRMTRADSHASNVSTDLREANGRLNALDALLAAPQRAAEAQAKVEAAAGLLPGAQARAERAERLVSEVEAELARLTASAEEESRRHAAAEVAARLEGKAPPAAPKGTGADRMIPARGETLRAAREALDAARADVERIEAMRREAEEALRDARVGAFELAYREALIPFLPAAAEWAIARAAAGVAAMPARLMIEFPEEVLEAARQRVEAMP